MTKILKKSLACLLVFALCFTAIASCLAVSAAAPAMSVGSLDLYVERPSSQNSTNPEVCEGERYRIQLGLGDLEAGSIIGISVLMPKGVELGDIAFQDMNWNANRGKVEVVSQYLDTETRWLKMIFNVTSNGDNIFFWRFNATANIPKDQVFNIYAVIEAANTSAAGDDNIFTYETNKRPMRVMTSHNVVTDAAVPATCEGTGLTEGSHCSRCEEVLVAQEEVKALGHDYEGVANPDSTCNSEGTMVYTCKNDASHTYTEAISKKDHTPAADLVNNEDGTHSVVCDVCGAKLETADHDFAEGDCACGATKPAEGPIIDEAWTLMAPSPGFGDNSLQIGFRARTTVFTKYNDVAIVIIPQKYDKTTLNYVENPEEIVIPYSTFSEGQGNFRTYYYKDILLYELGLNIDYKLRGTDASGNTVESPTNSTSVAEYLRTMVPADAYMATLVADTLIVGQSAMENMSATYPDSQLAKDAKATITAGYDLSAATKAFDMETCNKINNHNATNANFGTGTKDANRVTYSCGIGAAPTLTYRVKGLRELDVNKFAFHITYSLGNPDGSVTNYDETITYATNPEMFSGLDGNFLSFTFSDLGLQASSVTVNCVASYDGAEVFNSQYSVETYFYSNMSGLSAELQVLATNVLKLGASFKANASKNN